MSKRRNDENDDESDQAQRSSGTDNEEEDQERERIHEGHDPVEPEPGVTAALDDFTDEEKRTEPAGVMPGAGPDEEPGPDRDRLDSDTGAGDDRGDRDE